MADQLNETVRKAINYAYQDKHPGKYIGYKTDDQVITLFSDNDCHLRIHLLTSRIIRIRYSVRPFFMRDFSYALDPEFKSTSVHYEVEDFEGRFIIYTELLSIHIQKEYFRIDIYDRDGELLTSDEKGFHWEDNHTFGGEKTKMSKVLFAEESIYGLGDKANHQNLRGQRLENWGSDRFGYRKGSEPLYKNINFYYSFCQGRTYGIYFDNSFHTYYDIGQEREDIMSFWSDGGEMDYYFLYGENLMDVSTQYARLTGTAELPPMWALGYQQSKWSYFPESKVFEIADQLRSLEIPCDAIHLDIDYMDGFRCFTWNHDHFPDPKRMVRDLKDKGFKTIAIIDPGLKIDTNYSIFNQALDEDYFCKRMDGTYFQGKVWPGECYFPDFTHPEVRNWWSGLFESFIGDIELDGIWTDMNEPAVFDVPSKTFPFDVRHNYDGHPCSHRKAHNVYGFQMARATSEGVQKYGGGKRKLVLSRSGYAGMQRHTATWTGDNLSSWEHLYLAHVQTLRLSISGVSFCGTDVGGFIDQPDGELFVRWIQLAIFHPFFRNHSSGDHGDQEPWTFGPKNTSIIRDAIRLRYQLLPYLYTQFYLHRKSGKPILRPLVFDTNAEEDLHNEDEALFGDHLLFSPILNKNQREKDILIPEGRWYDYETGEVYEGRNQYTFITALSKIPLFVRAGAIIPNFPTMNYVGERPIEEVTLKVYYKTGKMSSVFYHDELDGEGYKSGDFRLAEFETHGHADGFSIEQRIYGHYSASFHSYRIQVFGIPESQYSIEVDGSYIHHHCEKETGALLFTLGSGFRVARICKIS